MSAGLDDQLTRVGVPPSVMADKPDPIIEEHPTGGRDLAGNLPTGATLYDEGRRGRHVPSEILSFRTQTLVAKNSRIIAV